MIDLVGTWRLVSASAWDGQDLVDPHCYGADPVGFIHYLADGRMSVNIAYGGRAAIAGDRLLAPAEQRLAAYGSYISYAGRYELTNDAVTHFVEVSAYQNDVGSVQRRLLSLDGATVVLTTAAPLLRNGRKLTFKVTWIRVATADASQ